MAARLVVLVLAVLCVGFAAAGSLLVDQAQTTFVTSFKIPAAGVWQSFTPSWTGDLSAINVLLGSSTVSSPCVPYSGVLQIYAGAGSHTTADYFTGRTPLLTQNVVSSNCQCSATNCVSWQQWVLDSPVSVVAEQEYAFYLSHDTNAAHAVRVAMMVVDSYSRGENYFRAPGYDFAFKTLMATDANAQASDNAVSQSGSSPLLVFGVGIVAAVVAVLAVVLLLIYRRRERMRKEWMSAEQAVAELRSRFNDVLPVTESAVDPVDVDSIAVSLDGERAQPIHNNWMLEERPNPRSRTGSLAFHHGPMALPNTTSGRISVYEAPDDDENDTVAETDLSYLPAPASTFCELPERAGPLPDNWTLEARQASVSPNMLTPASARSRQASLSFRRSPMALPGAPAVSVEDDVFDDVIDSVLAETNLSSTPPPFQELPERAGPLANNWILEERPAPAPASAPTQSRTLNRGPMALPAGQPAAAPPAHVELDFDDGATITETDLKFLPPIGEDMDSDN